MWISKPIEWAPVHMEWGHQGMTLAEGVAEQLRSCEKSTEKEYSLWTCIVEELEKGNVKEAEFWSTYYAQLLVDSEDYDLAFAYLGLAQLLEDNCECVRACERDPRHPYAAERKRD